jgi:hypothetical protein
MAGAHETGTGAAESLRSGSLRFILLGALAVLLPGCSGTPVSVASLTPSVDSIRYVSLPGTPSAVATVWHNGTVNVATEIHAIASSFNETCAFGETCAFRGVRAGDTVSGILVTTSDPSLDVTGTLEGTFSGDTLSGLIHTSAWTACGWAVGDASVRLVPESLVGGPL